MIARLRFLLVVLVLGGIMNTWTPSIFAETGPSLKGDARHPPERVDFAASSGLPSADKYQPSAFMAGSVAINLVFVQSNGSIDASSEQWTTEQINLITDQTNQALAWWQRQLPLARLSFTVVPQTVQSSYEPIKHSLSSEGQWIADVLKQTGATGSDYFDLAYSADNHLRKAMGTDWATTVFVVNSTNDPDGRFADGMFAYAYVNGPFMVITSDSGPYTINGLAPVITHELGHIFGALDQYAEAGVSCEQRSGYLAIPTTNSQLNNCGSRFVCIMLEPRNAYTDNAVDTSALGQLGYRDEDGDSIPDPLDTTPKASFSVSAAANGQRPRLAGSATETAYQSPSQRSVSINTITQVAYRVNGGDWIPLQPIDGSYNSQNEQFDSVLPLYDGTYTVDIKATNTAGNSAPIISQQVTVSGIGTAPAYSASAPNLTNKATIAVQLGSPAQASVQISTDPSFANVPWQSVQATVNYRLPTADDTYPVYIRFRDQAGLESMPLVRQVTLDTTPPDGNATIQSNGTRLSVQAEDSGSGVTAMQITTDVAQQQWQNFANDVALTQSTQRVTVQLRDAAGNVSAQLTAIQSGRLFIPLVQR